MRGLLLHLMDAQREARQYRLLAWRMRVEAEFMDRALNERKLETARVFEKIAETLERVSSNKRRSAVNRTP